ncbi:hypothetical protein [Secundilactobacillus oryzae]|nr:hypothetical protein [Secundilactobacillus oryzae]
MMHHEVEYVYYEHLLAEKYPDIDATAFLHDFVQNPEETVAKSAIDSADYYNWDRLMHPANYISDLDKSDVMADFLKYDIDEAKKGTKTGPLTSSFEVFRDTRDVYRRIATQNLLSPDDYRRDFLGTFNYQNSHLAVGPPEIRIEQLRALITAGVVQLLGPQMVVDTDEETGKFVTWSATLPDQKHESTYLLEGRLPSIKVSESQNPLIQQMLRDELAQPHEMKLANGESFRTGAMDVDVQTEQLLVNGQANQHLFFWGVPTEGKHWFTTASPRPYTNDVTFRLGDGIVDQIFETK